MTFKQWPQVCLSFVLDHCKKLDQTFKQKAFLQAVGTDVYLIRSNRILIGLEVFPVGLLRFDRV